MPGTARSATKSPVLEEREDLKVEAPGVEVLNEHPATPPGVLAKRLERQDLDADGLEAPATMPPLFATPESRASSFARFKHVSTHEFGADHWVVVRAWRPGECTMHGWSAAAGLTCGVFKAPCDEIDRWVQVCASLQPGAAPNESPVTAKSAFPSLEEAAANLAITAARAVVRSDPAKLLGTLGPKGVKILNKQYTVESLQAAMVDNSVLQVVAPIFGDPVVAGSHLAIVEDRIAGQHLLKVDPGNL